MLIADASQAPGAFALSSDPRNDPQVALLLPYGRAMAGYSAMANVTRNQDGVLRDIPLRETVGDWSLPSLPLRLATTAASRSPRGFAATVRPNWRENTRLPRISAADLLTGGRSVCRDATILLTSLDRGAEYRADEAAEIYLARAGMNPLALYALLQKMAALGSQSARLAQLYKTHPALDARMDRIDRRGHGVLEPYLSRE